MIIKTLYEVGQHVGFDHYYGREFGVIDSISVYISRDGYIGITYNIKYNEHNCVLRHGTVGKMHEGQNIYPNEA